MALTRDIVVAWLVEQCEWHLDQCKFTKSDDPINPLFTRVLGDGLRRLNLDPADPATVTDEEVAAVPAGSLTRFYWACLIALKIRIKNHYLAQVTQGVIQTRKEFDKRAKDLMADIASDEASYALEADRATASGAFGGRISDATNVPDAIFRHYHR